MSLPEPHLPSADTSKGADAGLAASPDTALPAIPMARWRRWAPWLVGAGVLGGAWHWTLSSWLPGWLPAQVQPVLARELGVPVTWQRLDIHPWTLQVSLHGLQVGQGERPLFKLRSFTVQPSWEVLWRWAPVLRRVTIEGPEVNVVREAPGRFNFTPLITHWQQRHPPQPDTGGEPARFAVFNIALRDGVVRFQDQVLQQDHTIDQLNVGVPFVSNLASLVDVDVEPALSARLDGSTLKVEGETLPFQQGRRSQVHLKWSGIRVAEVMEAVHPFVPAAWRPQQPAGELSADLTVRFEARTAPEVPRLGVSGQVALEGLGLQWAQLPVAVPALPPMAVGLGAAGGAAGGSGVGAVGQRPVAVSAALSWGQLKLQGIDAQPLMRQAQVQTVSLSGLKLAVAPAVGASVPAASASATGKTNAQPAAAAAPWAWSVAQVRLDGAELSLQPWVLPAGVKALPGLTQLQAQVDGLSADAKAKPARWRLSWRDTASGQFNAQGDVSVPRQSLSAQISLDTWSLPDWTQLASRLAAAPVRVDQGLLSAQIKVMHTPQGVVWQDGGLSLNTLLISPNSQRADKPGPNRLAWSALAVQGVQGSWRAPAAAPATGKPAASAQATTEARVQDITLTGLDANVLREAGNRWFGLTLPGGGEATAATSGASANPSSATSATGKASASPAPRIVLGSWRCVDCKLQLDDRSVSPATRLSLGPLQAQVSGLDTAQPTEPVRFELDTRALNSGRVQAQGQLRQQPLSLEARLRTSQVELKVLQPYLDPYVNVVLQGAEPELDGQLRWAAATARQPQQLRWSGRLGLRDLRLQDRVNAADFLSWRHLILDGTQIAMQGDQLDAQLGRIQLKDFYGRVIVNPDGKLNLAQILRSERGGETTSITTPQAASAVAPAASAPPSAAASASASASTPAPAVAAASAPAATRPAPQLAWRSVQLQGGRVDFTDHYIQPNYSARLTQVQGEVSAVSSRQSAPADLSISGAVDDAAPLRISGKVQPLGPQLYTDIEGSAKGIELSRLSPYAARYAGYGIDKGTLSVTVHYKVDQGQLEASNRVFLDQFTFGEASHSKDAIQLPIRFAVSLLTNARGEIDLNLPISGSINDPKFSVGGIIWQVFVNLVTKAVTAPFALLGGGDGEDWGHVPFNAGSAELTEAGRKRLDGLAKSLADRPALKIEATGHADVAADTLGLRQQHLAQLLRAAKARATGQPLADTRVAPAEEDTWLAAAYKAAELPNKPRNALGMAKSVPAAEMRSLLMAAAPAREPQLRELADERADQVKAYLAARIAPERVLLTASQVDPVAPGASQGGASLPPARVQMVLR